MTQHLNLGPLEKQQMLSNAEPSLQFLHTTKKSSKRQIYLPIPFTTTQPNLSLESKLSLDKKITASIEKIPKKKKKIYKKKKKKSVISILMITCKGSPWEKACR